MRISFDWLFGPSEQKRDEQRVFIASNLSYARRISVAYEVMKIHGGASLPLIESYLSEVGGRHTKGRAVHRTPEFDGTFGQALTRAAEVYGWTLDENGHQTYRPGTIESVQVTEEMSETTLPAAGQIFYVPLRSSADEMPRFDEEGKMPKRQRYFPDQRSSHEPVLAPVNGSDPMEFYSRLSRWDSIDGIVTELTKKGRVEVGTDYHSNIGKKDKGLRGDGYLSNVGKNIRLLLHCYGMTPVVTVNFNDHYIQLDDATRIELGRVYRHLQETTASAKI